MPYDIFTAIMLASNLPSFFRFLAGLALAACLFFVAVEARAAEGIAAELSSVGVDAVLGTQLPLNLPVAREDGQIVPFSSFFDGRRPVLLILSYYGCPMLCGLVLNSVRDNLQRLDWKPGDKYRIVTVSIDPNESSELARAKKKSILGPASPIIRASLEKNWAFLVGKGGSEKRIAEAVGFRFHWDGKEKQWAHSAAIFFVSPTGKLTRVLYGLDFPPSDLRLSLLEASEGRVGTLSEKLLLFCYHYDPNGNTYAIFATRLVSLGGALTVAALLMTWAWWRFRIRSEIFPGASENFEKAAKGPVV